MHKRFPALFLFIALCIPAFTARAAGDDLSVGWIARLPRVEYVWKSTNPAVEGWPAPGQTVTWVAHVRNLSGRALSNVGYRWSIDGAVVKEGTATIGGSEATTTFELPWTWTFTRHQIVFEIDPANSITENEERNNRLRIFSDAIGVGFWVERSFWQGVRTAIVNANFGGSTFDDWMQKRINQYNEMAPLAIYPETPHGVLDRWRIDDIHLVEDGALPIVPPGAEVRDWGAGEASWPVLYPNSADRTIDIQWGFPKSSVFAYSANTSWTLLYDSFIHELGHARYAIDVYGWNLDDTHDLIEIEPKPPTVEGVFFRSPDWGLMNTQWGFIDRYTAVALNRIRGFRATEGTYNEPRNMGVFLNDLPLQNRIRLVTPDGTTFPRRQVKLYKSSSRLDPDWRSHPYQIHIDGTPDLVVETDDEGAILVGRNPISDGDLTMWVDRCNVVSVIELVDGETRHYAYLESRILNYAYWRGETAFAEHTVTLDQPICWGPGIGANDVLPAHEALVKGREVTFSFPVQKDHRYDLVFSIDGKKAVSRELGVMRSNRPLSMKLQLEGKRVAWWYVDHDPAAAITCLPKRSATYFFDLEVPERPRKRPVRPR